jgi:hypothetical protein
MRNKKEDLDTKEIIKFGESREHCSDEIKHDTGNMQHFLPSFQNELSFKSRIKAKIHIYPAGARRNVSIPS